MYTLSAYICSSGFFRLSRIEIIFITLEYSAKKYLRALDPRTETKTSTSFVRERPGTVFSSSSLCSRNL